MKSEILVMDCEERRTFWLTLKSDYKILFATTAEEGLEMLSDNVGLVFLSTTLPDMKSMEVFRLIKKEHSSTAVIVITACGKEEKSIEPFRKEANDYAKRPLEADEVLQKIRTLVSMNDDTPKQESGSFREIVQDGQYPDIPSNVVKGVLRVRDFLAHHYSASLTLSAACKMASVSKTYFCHFFKRITGHSLRSYQHLVKMEMAGEFLRNGRLSVKEVSRKLGYNDPNYFSTIYKRIMGISPKQLKAHGQSIETEHVDEQKKKAT